MMRVRGNKRKKRRRNRWLIRTIPFLLLIGAGIGIFCYIQRLAFRVCRVEAGVQISASDFMKNKDFKAINVTIPYKQDVIPYLDEISAEAKSIGAVNTVVNKNGKLYGHNTDVEGMKYMRN